MSSPFPPGFITPALVSVMGRVCPTRPLGGDLSCILHEVAEHHPDAHEDVHVVVEAYPRHHGDETPDDSPDDTDAEDPASQAGLHEFHRDLLSLWEAVIGFAVDHLDVRSEPPSPCSEGVATLPPVPKGGSHVLLC